MVILLLPLSRRVVVKQKYVHKVLLNPLVKLAEENSVFRSTDDLHMTIAVDWDIKPQTKQINYHILFTGLDKQFFTAYNCKYFITHHFNICFGRLKELSH